MDIALISDHVPVESFIAFYGTNQAKKNYITPPRNRGGVIFSLQFVCVSVCVLVCVCVCVCPALLVNKIPAERMHRFGRDFH